MSRNMSAISPVETVATLPNGLQLRLCWTAWDKVAVCTRHYYYVHAGLHGSVSENKDLPTFPKSVFSLFLKISLFVPDVFLS